MIVGQTQPELQQQQLFDSRIVRNLAAARYWIGNFYERQTSLRFGAERIKTDSRADICPDLYAHPHFLEVKSAGKNNAVIIYTERLQKELRFVHHQPLLNCYRYVIWHHTLIIKPQLKLSMDVQDLESALWSHTKEMLVLDLTALARFLLGRPCRVVNTGIVKTGPNTGQVYGRGARLGWVTPLSLLRTLAVARETFNGPQATPPQEAQTTVQEIDRGKHTRTHSNRRD